MNMKSLLPLVLIPIGGLVGFGFVAGLVFVLPENDPQHCYFVVDELGNEHQSEFGPYFGDYGIYFDTDEEWGVITSPVGMRVDKDCLRRKGVDVGPVQEMNP